MLALTREALVNHLVVLPKVVDPYVRGEAAFAEYVVAWLGDVQETLTRLRSPLVSLVASGRGSIAAVTDGLQVPAATNGRVTLRKARRAAAAAVLDRVDNALRAKVTELDARLEMGRERIAQILAVCNGQVNLSRPEGEVPRLWYDTLWAQIGQIAAVRDAHVFISASFTAGDRAYLIEDLLDRIQG